jgi:hypothetical protein
VIGRHERVLTGFDQKSVKRIVRGALVSENGMEKAPPLQKPQGWATQLQRQSSKAKLKGKKPNC